MKVINKTVLAVVAALSLLGSVDAMKLRSGKVRNSGGVYAPAEVPARIRDARERAERAARARVEVIVINDADDAAKVVAPVVAPADGALADAAPVAAPAALALEAARFEAIRAYGIAALRRVRDVAGDVGVAAAATAVAAQRNVVTTARDFVNYVWFGFVPTR